MLVFPKKGALLESQEVNLSIREFWPVIELGGVGATPGAIVAQEVTIGI